MMIFILTKDVNKLFNVFNYITQIMPYSVNLIM